MATLTMRLLGNPEVTVGGQSLSFRSRKALALLINLCWPYIAQKQLEAARQANQEALDIWRALGNTPKLLETYDMQEFILFAAGDHEGVLAAASEAFRLSRSIGNRSIQRRVLGFTGDIQSIRGQFGQALANLEAAMSLSKEVGTPLSMQLYYYGWLQSLCLYAGALDQAEGWADKLYALQESMMPVFQTSLLTGIARVKIACGKLDQARIILEQMLEDFNWNSSWSHTITSIAIADGYLQLALGKPELVCTRWQEQVRQFRAAGFHQDLATEMWLRGKAYLALEEVDQAKDALLGARTVAEEKGERTILWRILATLSELEEGCGDREAAKKLNDQAREVIEYIAENAGELRDAFLAQPAVAQILHEN